MSPRLHFVTKRVAYKLRLNEALGNKNGSNNIKYSKPNFKVLTALSVPVVWPVLVGYVWVIFSFSIGFEQAASGAVLVGVCIAAELMLNRLLWRRAAQSFGDSLVQKKKYEEGWFYGAADGSMMVSGFTEQWDLLFNLSTTGKSRDGTLWGISTTLHEFDTYVGWFIGLSAILGTLIWGYTDWVIGKCA